jgi:antitoxin Phd
MTVTARRCPLQPYRLSVPAGIATWSTDGIHTAHIDTVIVLYSTIMNVRLFTMSEPARDLPVSSPAVEQAVELARRGVITHLTIHGERVAAIVPESLLDALRAAEDAEDAAEADAAIDEPGESIPWEQVKAELGM